MIDPTLQHLEALSPATADRAFALVYAARQAGIPLMVTSSRRSPEEQRRLLEQGRTRTLNSAHLSGDAFDVDVAGLGRDQVPRWVWSAIGPYGEALGLIWGGRWRSFPDLGHFELLRHTV